METGKQTVISARKAKAIRRKIEESRASLQYTLKTSVRDRLGRADAREPRTEALPKFLISRTAR